MLNKLFKIVLSLIMCSMLFACHNNNDAKKETNTQQNENKKKQEEIRYPDSKDQTCPKELNAPNQQEVTLSPLERG